MSARSGRVLVAALAGAGVAVGTWLLFVPWDLSEVTADGRAIEGGGDDSGGAIALVGVVVVALGLAAVVRPSTRSSAAAFVGGGFSALTVLFAWRAGVAETVGANLFIAPLIALFVPATIVAPLVVRVIALRLDRRSSATAA